MVAAECPRSGALVVPVALLLLLLLLRLRLRLRLLLLRLRLRLHLPECPLRARPAGTCAGWARRA